MYVSRCLISNVPCILSIRTRGEAHRQETNREHLPPRRTEQAPSAENVSDILQYACPYDL
jgi:hypothetical protein